MNFQNYVNDNKLYLEGQKVDINELISFLQKNKNITQLSLIRSNVNGEDIKILASSDLKNLTTLNLGWNDIGHQGAEALAKSENLKNLTTLHLARNLIGNEGAEALAKSENLKNLTTLHLAWN
ncbi:MAG: AAA family ATPase, partial [Rickettsiaceae bacterium]|nr:AAA family ATPase [Rickettsiaceae bacterium]